ncbi:MAG: hypothetical protein F6J87_25635 [Spirulina sp. SIO3F2]|nr:hypothetical protein [Spirulina sp. SIO3F2]
MPPSQQPIPPEMHSFLTRQKKCWTEQPIFGEWGHIHIVIESEADFDRLAGHDGMLGENFDTLHTYDVGAVHGSVNACLHLQHQRLKALAVDL